MSVLDGFKVTYSLVREQYEELATSASERIDGGDIRLGAYRSASALTRAARRYVKEYIDDGSMYVLIAVYDPSELDESGEPSLIGTTSMHWQDWADKKTRKECIESMVFDFD